MGMLGSWFWLSQRQRLNQWQRTSTNLLRDSAIGLSVGVSAHLVWDALLSSSKRGFYIRGFGGTKHLTCGYLQTWPSALAFPYSLPGLCVPTRQMGHSDV